MHGKHPYVIGFAGILLVIVSALRVLPGELTSQVLRELGLACLIVGFATVTGVVPAVVEIQRRLG